jgi:hypothetical protein
MKDSLSNDEYLRQCDEAIFGVLVLHSLEYSELIKLDGPLFPIDFEVWSETREAESHITYKNYTEKISEDIAAEIGLYLNSLLDLPSEKWTYTEFESNPFWERSRSKANDLVKRLELKKSDYW